MKKINTYRIIICFFAVSFASCKKTQLPHLTSSSLTIVNAINDAGTLVTNFDRNHKLSYYKTAATIDSNGYFEFSGYAGKLPLQLVQYSDTTHQVVNVDLNIQPGSMQTLFLTGTLAKPDTVLVKDNMPRYNLADSLAGIRFANLSPGSGNVSVDLQRSGQGVILKSLPYKGVTNFIPFPVKQNTPASRSYVFEFRDVVSGNLLATYTLNQSISILSKNVTIALTGIVNNGTQTVLLINNYLLDLGQPQ